MNIAQATAPTTRHHHLLVWLGQVSHQFARFFIAYTVPAGTLR